MGTALVDRVEFAERAGVNPSSVTAAARRELAEACDGNRIDVSHPAAQAYLQRHTIGTPVIDPATGLDVLYANVLEWVKAHGLQSTEQIATAFQVDVNRMDAMLSIVRVSGSSFPVSDAPTAPVLPLDRAVPFPAIAGGNGAEAGIPSSITGMSMRSGFDPIVRPLDSIDIPQEIQSVADLSLREIIGLYGTNTRFIEWLNAIKAIEMIEEKRLKNAKAEGTLVARELIFDHVIEPIDATIRQMLTDGVKTIVARVVAMHEAGEDITALEELVGDQMSSFFKPMKKKIIRGLKNA